MGLILRAADYFRNNGIGEDFSVGETVFLHKDWQPACNLSFSVRRKPVLQSTPSQSVISAVLSVKVLQRHASFWEDCRALLGSSLFPQKSIQKLSQELWHLIGCHCSPVVWDWCVAAVRLPHGMFPDNDNIDFLIRFGGMCPQLDLL